MSRKVFLSILGTSFYHKCIYTKGTFRSVPTRYIQEATLDCLDARHWNPEQDKIYIFCTEKSQRDNWNADITTRLDFNKTEQPYIRLEKVLDDKGFATPMLEKIMIPDGNNEEEQWNIFTTIFEQLKEGDELYLDITHGFRSLPMLLLVLCNYAKFLKHTVLKSITYGNFEARNIEKNEAPIIDLSPIALLQDWTFSAANFIENGKTEALHTLCKQEVGKMFQPNSSKQKEKDKGRKIGDYMNRVAKLVDNIQLCRGRYLLDKETMERLHENEASIPQDILQPFQPILGKITEAVDSFRPEKSAGNMWEAADWCRKKNMFQQSITFLQEGIISCICERYGWNVQDAPLRTVISEFLNRLRNKDTAWLKEGNDSQKLQLYKDKELYDQFSKPFSDLTKLRNTINHASMNENQLSEINAVKKNIENYIAKFKLLFFEQDATDTTNSSKG